MTLGLAALVLTLAIGCGSSSGSVTRAPSSPPTVLPTAGPTEMATPLQSASPASAVVTVDQSKNGQSVTLEVGRQLRVVLDSMYWTFSTDVSAQALSLIAGPQVDAAGNCPPGVGCGTVSATYLAQKAGTAEVTATRTLCGEAVQCSPDQTSFKIEVTVVGS